MIFVSLQRPDKFGTKLSGINRLQSDLKAAPEEGGKFVVSMMNALKKIDYFEVPDVTNNGLWINGLDGKDKVSDCLKLHKDEALAYDSLCSFAGRFLVRNFDMARMFKTVYHSNGDLELVQINEYEF